MKVDPVWGKEVILHSCLRGEEALPDHTGDARGNRFRWQDYLAIADAAITSMAGDGVLVRLDRHDGYEDVAAQLVAEDAIGDRWPSYTTLAND